MPRHNRSHSLYGPEHINADVTGAQAPYVLASLGLDGPRDTYITPSVDLTAGRLSFLTAWANPNTGNACELPTSVTGCGLTWELCGHSEPASWMLANYCALPTDDVSGAITVVWPSSSFVAGYQLSEVLNPLDTTTSPSLLQRIDLVGYGGTDTFKLTYNGIEDATVFTHGSNGTAAAIQAALRTATGDTTLIVKGMTNANPANTNAGPFFVRFTGTFTPLSVLSVTSVGGCTGSVTQIRDAVRQFNYDIAVALGFDVTLEEAPLAKSVLINITLHNVQEGAVPGTDGWEEYADINAYVEDASAHVGIESQYLLAPAAGETTASASWNTSSAGYSIITEVCGSDTPPW